MNTRGLSAIQKYAAGGLIVQKPDGTTTYTTPTGLTQRVFGPTGLSILQSVYPNAVLLPSNFSSFSPSEKISFFNQNNITEEQIRANDPTLTQEGLNWMRSQGYTVGTGLTRAQAEQTVRNTFSNVLGRQPLAEGLNFWTNELLNNPAKANTLAQDIAFGAQGDDQVAANAWAQQNLGRSIFNLGGGTTSGGTTSGGTTTSLTRAQAEQTVRNTFDTVLRRQPLQVGLDYWTNELLNNPAKAATLAQDIAYGAQGGDQVAANAWAQANLGKPIFNLGDVTTGAGTIYQPFGNPNYTWNSLDPVSTKQSIVQKMLADGLSVQQIRDEISRLATDRSALTEENFNLLGLGLTGGTTTSLTREQAEQTVRNTFDTVLRRQPLAEGLDFWINELLNNPAKVSTLAQDIAYGAQGPDQAAANAWAQANLGRPIFNLGSDTGGTDGTGGVDGGAVLPGPDQYSGVPLFERQQPSALTFQPIQRGLAQLSQLRPAAFMPGLTAGQPSFGGSGFTPEQLRASNAGLYDVDRAYLMDVGGISPAELASAIGAPTGQLQGLYNFNRPGGLFATTTQAPTGLPEDFVLQTGAYTPNVTAINPVTGLPYVAPRENINAGMDEFVRRREGGVINMAEGGKAMTKLTPAEAGSKFDISEFIDDQGRLISGYSRPVVDEYGVIVGYDYRPYERDVVFNPILARREEEERQGRRRMAKGGLASIAQDLADKGRFGDTMVAHISPQEAGLLKALGGAGTINPETGLPEFFKIFGIDLFPKKGIKLNLGPLGNIKIGRKSSDLLLAAAAGYAGASGYMGLNPGTAALAYGGVRAAATGNLMEGIQAGLTAYGMGSGFESMGVQPASATGTAPIDTVPVGSGGVEVGVDPGVVTSQQVPIQGTEAEFLAARPEFGQATTEALSGMPTSGTTLGQAAAPTSTQIAAREAVAYNPLSNPEVGGMENLGVPFEVQAVSPDNATALAKQGYLGRTLPAEYQKYVPDFMLEASGPALATGTLLGTSLIAGQQERAAAAAQQAALNREREERKRRYDEVFRRTFGPLSAKEGGLMKLAKGGMTYMEAGGTTGVTGEPRDVTGTGDGMSDSVPASIEGVQEARLADGEFVIPADVVADIGNGSSDAGSKKLYDMMDRIRMARHGTTEQPPEIKAERLMPA